MSTTQRINLPSQGGFDGKKKVVAGVAAGVAAAGAAAAGAVLMNDDEEPVEPIIVDDDDPMLHPEEPPIPEVNPGNTSGGSSATPSSNTGGHHTSTPSNNTQSGGSEPQPITDNGGGAASVADPVVDPGVEQPVEVTIEEPAVTEQPEVQIESGSDVGTAQTETPQEVVDPDQIAEAIISEEQIDPNDLDMADVVNFDEIGTVYTVDGESYTAAAFHDGAGNNLIMVDVDGDNVFDLITDYDGNVLADVLGNLSVGDAVENIEDDDVYLAYDPDTDNVDEFGADTLSDDILTT